MGRLLAVLCAAVCCYAQTSGIEGNWQGTLAVGGVKLRLGLHVTKDSSGKLMSKLDSIDQAAMGIPVGTTTLKGDRLMLDLPSLQATFNGTLQPGASEIVGTFTQGADMPLTFRRVETVEALNRPQNPKPPFPYEAVDVKYENDGVTLAGTLTLPRGTGPFPAALLITGSGPQDRDETLMGHKPFWVIADYLTRHGIAVLRVDDRGVHESTGNSTAATFRQMAGDVLAGVHFLQARKEIDRRRVGVIGHSEGGIVGPLAASQSTDIGFVIMLAGTGVPGDQLLHMQAELIMRSQGASEQMIAQNREVQDFIFGVLRQEKNEPDGQAVLRKLRDEWKAKNGTEPSSGLQTEFARVTSNEMRSLIFEDPADILRQVKAPVLAMNGSRDVQVPPQQNLPAIVAALTGGGNPDVTVVELPGLNHLFQHCKTCAPGEYGELEETFSTEALEIMGDWLGRHVRK
ncbi:MAG TPA: alpha/beta fold hydrolase [Bryobacteraceae bacterium]|nr:alpha/beta fold hydrolase [Bryobacteraceae bacterium]